MAKSRIHKKKYMCLCGVIVYAEKDNLSLACDNHLHYQVMRQVDPKSGKVIDSLPKASA